jgi:hypothetical protein
MGGAVDMLPEHEAKAIRQYVDSQTRDESDRARAAQRVGGHRVAGHARTHREARTELRTAFMAMAGRTTTRLYGKPCRTYGVPVQVVATLRPEFFGPLLTSPDYPFCRRAPTRCGRCGPRRCAVIEGPADRAGIAIDAELTPGWSPTPAAA